MSETTARVRKALDGSTFLPYQLDRQDHLVYRLAAAVGPAEIMHCETLIIPQDNGLLSGTVLIFTPGRLVRADYRNIGGAAVTDKVSVDVSTIPLAALEGLSIEGDDAAWDAFSNHHIPAPGKVRLDLKGMDTVLLPLADKTDETHRESLSVLVVALLERLGARE